MDLDEFRIPTDQIRHIRCIKANNHSIGAKPGDICALKGDGTLTPYITLGTKYGSNGLGFSMERVYGDNKEFELLPVDFIKVEVEYETF